MAQWLKQSVASITVKVGPFLDSTDGNTVEGSLTLTQPDIRLSKNGGAFAQKAAAQTLSYDENGYYDLTLDDNDTDTLGRLTVHIHESGALPVWHEFMVVPANVWDSMFGADNLEVDTTLIEGGDATTALQTATSAVLVTYGMDHLLINPVTGIDIVDNSIVAKLVSKEATADWDDYNNTTDSLQALRDNAGTAGAALTDLGGMSTGMKAEVESECNDALVAQKLDHLVAVADSDDPVNNSIIAKLASKGATADWSDYANTTDSLEAAHDHASTPLRLLEGTSTNSSTTAKVYIQAGDPPTSGADDDYNGCLIAVWDGPDKTTARVNIRTVSDYDDSDPSFTVSDVLGFTPVSGDLVEIYGTDPASAAALQSISDGFATGVDTLENYLVAIMDKSATAPSNVGTYTPAADSLEVLSERQVLMQGAAFDTSTDSLKELRDAFDEAVLPSVVGSSALSGDGFLSDCVAQIRQWTDEPSLVPKYTGSDIVGLIQTAMTSVLADLQAHSDHSILVRHNITLASGTQYYQLPPHVGELWRVAKLISGGTTPQYEVWPGNHWSGHQGGFVLEGNTLRLLQDWQSTDTLELLYVPTGESYYHLGTGTPGGSIRNTDYTWPASGSGVAEHYCQTSGSADPSLGEPDSLYIDGTAATKGTLGSLAAGEWGYGDNDSLGYSTVYVRLSDGSDPHVAALHHIQVGTGTIGDMTLSDENATLILAGTPTDGTLDTRENCYAGYQLRILTTTPQYVQERQITAYDNETRQATVGIPFQKWMTTATTYEIVPTFSGLLRAVVCYQAAMDIHGAEGNAKRLKTLNDRYQERMRSLRTMVARKSSRFPSHALGDTSDNERLGWVVG
jgi:hypothetical protein